MAKGPDGLSKLDANQVIRRQAVVTSDDSLANQVLSVGGSLVPEEYDNIAVTYVASGNGVGEIETATFSLDGSTIATLTLSYDAQSRLINVARS